MGRRKSRVLSASASIQLDGAGGREEEILADVERRGSVRAFEHRPPESLAGRHPKLTQTTPSRHPCNKKLSNCRCKPAERLEKPWTVRLSKGRATEPLTPLSKASGWRRAGYVALPQGTSAAAVRRRGSSPTSAKCGASTKRTKKSSGQRRRGRATRSTCGNRPSKPTLTSPVQGTGPPQGKTDFIGCRRGPTRCRQATLGFVALVGA